MVDRGASVVWRSLLLCDDLTNEAQRAVFSFAKSSRDMELLALLAHYPGLNEEFDRAIGAIPYARVRQAWLTRAGRDGSVIKATVAKEKRSTVLIKLSDDQKLERACVSVLVGAALKRRLAELGISLLEHQELEGAERCDLARMVAQAGREGSAGIRESRRRIFEKIVEKDAQMAEAVIGVTRDVRVANLCLGVAWQLPDQIQRNVFDNVIAPAVLDAADTNKNRNGYSSWRSPVLSCLTRFCYSQTLGDELEQDLRVLLASEDVVSWLTSAGMSRDQSAKDIMTYAGEQRNSFLEDARETTSEEKLRELAEHASRVGDQPLAEAVLANLNCKDETAEISRIVGIKAAVAVARLSDQRERRAAIMVNHLSTVESWMVEFEDPGELIAEIFASVAEGRVHHNWYSIAKAASLECVGDEAVLNLPASLFVYNGAEGLRRRASGIITQALDREPAAWEIFGVLAADNLGMRLRDLLDACLIGGRG